MKHVAIGILFVCLSLPACERRHEPAPQQPTTRVAIATIATTAPAEPASQPAARIPSTVVINGQAFAFPPAKLVLKKTEAGIRATLFSDDPPEALKDDYVGNSFYFDVTIEAETIDDLAGQQFVYRNSAGERSNSTTGIFIAGTKQVLQPLTAAVGFDNVDGRLIAFVGGEFQLFDDQTPDAQALTVKVQARLTPSAQPTLK